MITVLLDPKGHLVEFLTVPEDSRSRAARFSQLLEKWGVYYIVLRVLRVVLLLGAALVAARNLRLDRGDRRGAFRLALYVFLLYMLAWLFQASHVMTLDEADLLAMGLVWALYYSVSICLYYLALEPYVRRLWPESLMSWSRLLAGRFRDVMVGRDLLVGTLCGVAVALLLQQLNTLAPAWLGRPPAPIPPGTLDHWLNPLIGFHHSVAELCVSQIDSVEMGLLYGLLFFFVLRVGLRKEWLAACAFVLFYGASRNRLHPIFMAK